MKVLRTAAEIIWALYGLYALFTYYGFLVTLLLLLAFVGLTVILYLTSGDSKTYTKRTEWLVRIGFVFITIVMLMIGTPFLAAIVGPVLIIWDLFDPLIDL